LQRLPAYCLDLDWVAKYDPEKNDRNIQSSYEAHELGRMGPTEELHSFEGAPLISQQPNQPTQPIQPMQPTAVQGHLPIRSPIRLDYIHENLNTPAMLRLELCNRRTGFICKVRIAAIGSGQPPTISTSPPPQLPDWYEHFFYGPRMHAIQQVQCLYLELGQQVVVRT
jgi:hypothetical protein